MFEGLSRSAFGGAGTILVTSLVWAGIHLQYDWYGMVSVFAAGLMLGYIRLRTGSVLITSHLDGLMNLIATIEAAFQLHFRG